MSARKPAMIILFITALIMTFYPEFGIDKYTAMQVVNPILIGYVLHIAIK